MFQEKNNNEKIFGKLYDRKNIEKIIFFSIFLIDNYLYFFNYRKKIFIDLWKK
jgi:hypothetical protein